MKYQNSAAIKLFFRAVSIKRPYDGPGAGSLLVDIVRRLPRKMPLWFDGTGNLHVDNRQGGRTLVVAHTDTVHHTEGVNKWTLDKAGVCRADGDVLGADNAAGVAILFNLLYNNAPVYGIFTVGEECGGIGARYLATNHSRLLQEFDRAITFDRKDSWHVITHQGGQRCCSEAFAEALAGQLNDRGLIYAPNDGGIYTDTAEFVDFVSECTNVSTGYFLQHSREEHQDTAFLDNLMTATLSMDWEALPTERKIDGEDSELEAEFVDALQDAAAGLPKYLQNFLIYYGYCTPEETRIFSYRARAKVLLEDIEDGRPWSVKAFVEDLKAAHALCQ